MQSAAADSSGTWTLTHDTSRTGKRYRKQVDNGRSRGAKGTIDVSRYAAAPRRGTEIADLSGPCRATVMAA